MSDKVLVSDSNLKAIADAIRGKNGRTDKYTPGEMATAISNITTGGGGDTTKEDGLVTGELTTYENDRVTSVKNNLFFSDTNITSVSFPAATKIGIRAFQDCTNINSVNINSATIIKNSAFENCTNIKSIDIPNVTRIGGSAFYECTALASVNMPNARIINSFAFARCTSLTSVTMPSVTALSDSAFGACTALKSIIIGSDASTKVCSVSVGTFELLPDDYTITVPHQLWDEYLANSSYAPYRSHLLASEHDLAKITVNAASAVNIYGDTVSGVTATVTYNETNNCPANQQGVTWSVSGNATIDSTGTVTLTDAAGAGDTITVTATSTYDTAITATATIAVINVAPSASITALTPDGAWIDSGDTVDGHTVYKSDAGSYNIDSGESKAQITVNGYTNLTICCKQSSEIDYNYVEIGPLDGTVSRESSSNILSLQGTKEGTWKSVSLNLDGGTHTVEVLYSKDSSNSVGDDRGYFYAVGSFS